MADMSAASKTLNNEPLSDSSIRCFLLDCCWAGHVPHNPDGNADGDIAVGDCKTSLSRMATLSLRQRYEEDTLNVLWSVSLTF